MLTEFDEANIYHKFSETAIVAFILNYRPIVARTKYTYMSSVHEMRS